ncbi:MAG: hypothetical protein QOJ09_300, partial [Actinomycetota bacterium]|nr:hypothetical protein [Actinomycetota bacterium]
FQDPSRWDVPRAAAGPSSWPRVRGLSANAPRRAVMPASVSRIRTTDDRITFDVDRVGVPVLVKTSFFPNWQASGAKGPWRVTPNQMVVVPTKKHVELHFGYTSVDYLGNGLSVLGLVGVVLLAIGDRRSRRRAGDGDASSEEGAVEPVHASAYDGEPHDDDLDGPPVPREEPVAVPTSSDP